MIKNINKVITKSILFRVKRSVAVLVASSFVAMIYVQPVIAVASDARSQEKTLCVYDPLGANGPMFQSMKDYQVSALSWQVSFRLRPYTDERVTAEDFKSGVCDAAIITGAQARQFNHFTGTLDSVGSIPTYDHLKKIFQLLSTKKAAKRMRSGQYEVAGLLPGGATYLFVNDRGIDTVNELSGKRFAILDSDPAQRELVMFIGASPIGASIATMYSKFNNDTVDITFGPAVVYSAMELYKGLTPNGGVIRFPITQLTMQMFIRHERFDDDFGQLSREYFNARFDKALQLVLDSEKQIDRKWWVEISQPNYESYSELMRQARLELKDQGIFNGDMLRVLRKLRCKLEPTRVECASADKE